MKIEYYTFGKIIINGKTFTRDIIIYPERINPSWWRKEGHLLQMEDLIEVISEKPDVLIIGTGYSGVMKVPEEVIKGLRSSGIHVVVETTQKAVEIFNQRDRAKKTVAALHLTC